MAALLWILAWLCQVLLAINELPPPVNLTMTSSHFTHMLNWEPGQGTPTGVYYRVTVTREKGHSWVPVVGCEKVQLPLVCNLTEAFADPIQVYLTQITAVLGTQTSKPVIYPGFKPIKDTHRDLPSLTVISCAPNLCVYLHPPMERLREYYNILHYKLRIKSNGVDPVQFYKDTKSLNEVILKDLAPGRQYCVSVCFTDSQVLMESNYSQPVCAFTASIYPAGTDAWIAATLCVLVISGVVFVAWLVSPFFLSLRRTPPTVLTSIRHIEEVLVLAPCSKSSPCALNLKAMLPSSDETRSNTPLSDQSDGESVTESTGWSKEGGYKLRVGTNILSSSSSSSSLSSQLNPGPKSHFSSNATSATDKRFHPQPETRVSDAGVKNTLREQSASNPDSLPDPCPPADTDTLTAGRLEPNEEDEVVGEGEQDVNLLTLTFGRQEEEGEGSHPEASFSAPTLPSQTWDTKEVAIKTVSFFVDEEEEEEEGHSGYIGRPCTDILQNLL